MNEITWIQPYYHTILGLINRKTETILDVGFGYGILGYILRQTRKARLFGIDPFYEDKYHIYNDTWRKTWQEWFDDMWSYDVIVATEVIEHMELSDATDFLEESKKITKRVIIATPKEFEEQKEYDNNPYQKHLSLISNEEFEKHGYETIQLENNIIAVWPHLEF